MSEDKEITDSDLSRNEPSITKACSDEPKMLEDKEVDDFLNSESKKGV
ncbi:10940_t:CDS:1, partial [Acaulospora morrowiae]